MNKILPVLILFLLLACGSRDASWFPLGADYWWQYSVVRLKKGESHEQKVVLANLPGREIDGITLYPRKRPDGRVEYYEKTGGTIYLYDPEDGSRTPVFREPVKVGTQWKALSRIRFLEVTGAFTATFNMKIQEEFDVDYRIESTDEVVEVAAGRFENCVHVSGAGSLYAGGGSLKEFMAIDTINIEVEEWYAPGVGLVKRRRKEYTWPLEFENIYIEELEKVKTG